MSDGCFYKEHLNKHKSRAYSKMVTSSTYLFFVKSLVSHNNLFRAFLIV